MLRQLLGTFHWECLDAFLCNVGMVYPAIVQTIVLVAGILLVLGRDDVRTVVA